MRAGSYYLSAICICFWATQVSGAQRIAEMKCQEYIDSLSESSFGGTLSVVSTIFEFKTTNCTTSVDLIVGGEEAQVGEFPHQALLGYARANASDKFDFFCGGSLISEWYVLTAAHCKRGSMTPKIVRLGEHNLNDETDGQKDYNVHTFTKHPNYSIKHSYHDIALVRLTQPVEFDDRIHPACLWTSSPYNMSAVVATGFGSTGGSSSSSSTLMKVRLNMLDGKRCEETIAKGGKYINGLIESQLCFGSRGGGKDTCGGDSGGPIQIATDIHSCAYHIVGVTKGGNAMCGAGNSEAIYTQVASYLDWIEKVVWPEDEQMYY